MRMGRHMPVGSHATQALQLTQEIGGDTLQIFVTNPRAWQPPAPNPEAESAFRTRAEELGWPVVVHAAYIINLASPRDDIFERSISLLQVTMRRAEAFGAGSVVFHIGSHTGAGEDAGLRRLARGIERTLADTPDGVMLLLENDTGGGGKLGYRMEILASALDQSSQYAPQLGVCIDISHRALEFSSPTTSMWKVTARRFLEPMMAAIPIRSARWKTASNTRCSRISRPPRSSPRPCGVWRAKRTSNRSPTTGSTSQRLPASPMPPNTESIMSKIPGISRAQVCG